MCLRRARFHSEIRALVLALILALVLASLVKNRLYDAFFDLFSVFQTFSAWAFGRHILKSGAASIPGCPALWELDR